MVRGVWFGVVMQLTSHGVLRLHQSDISVPDGREGLRLGAPSCYGNRNPLTVLSSASFLALDLIRRLTHSWAFSFLKDMAPR
jgi:hypothetical protein